MSHTTDKRFKSFLWSQTRKADFAETRLTVTAPEPSPPPPPTGRAKGRLTPIEQATMRMSEFCAPPTGDAVPDRAPGDMPAPDWQQLHVHRHEAAGMQTPLGRLNVRQAT